MFSAEYINQDGWVASYSNSCLCWEWRSRNRCGPQVRMSSNEPSVSPCAWLNWRAPLCARPQFWASCYFYPQLTFSEFKLEYWDTLLRGITTIHCLSWGSCSLFPTVRGTLAILPYPHRVPSVWKGVSWVNRDSSGFVSPCLSFPSLLPLHFFPPSSWDTVSYSGLASNPSHSWGWPWADHLPGRDCRHALPRMVLWSTRDQTQGFKCTCLESALPAEIHGQLTCGFPRIAFWCRELYGIRKMAWPLKRLRFTTKEIVIVCIARICVLGTLLKAAVTVLVTHTVS